jgi:multidrug resistance efflux pump
MRRTIIVSVLLAIGLLSWIYWQKSRPPPFIVSGFVEADEIRVGSRIGGRVAEVLVEEGRRITPGEPLFRIEPYDLREQLAQAKATLSANQAEHARLTAGYRREEVEQARARRDQIKATLEKLVAGPRPQEIAMAREQLKIAQANLDLAETEYARVQRLQSEAQAAQKEFDEATRALKAGRGELARAREQVALLEEGTRKEEIAQARAALVEMEQLVKLQEEGYRKEDIARAAAEAEAAAARVAAIEKQITELTVASPGECVVETIDLRPGDIVAPNAPAVSLLDLSRMWVRAYVPESRLGQVQLEQKVPVRVDSFPGRRFAGRVTFIARDAEFTPRNIQTPEERSKQVFRIKVTLDEGREKLRVGMAADLLLDQQAP